MIYILLVDQDALLKNLHLLEDFCRYANFIFFNSVPFLQCSCWSQLYVSVARQLVNPSVLAVGSLRIARRSNPSQQKPQLDPPQSKLVLLLVTSAVDDDTVEAGKDEVEDKAVATGAVHSISPASSSSSSSHIHSECAPSQVLY